MQPAVLPMSTALRAVLAGAGSQVGAQSTRGGRSTRTGLSKGRTSVGGRPAKSGASRGGQSMHAGDRCFPAEPQLCVV